ncbi:mas-related G-protein coupled receptor member H-like, partial [Protobothrops mucrosquamatus]|uniref:mas-related G-protein coupled receptor member H-like n=1 Tax=Protobothrops mucrosquamatus TaxID=103944 RepID=UPI0010FAEFD3
VYVQKEKKKNTEEKKIELSRMAEFGPNSLFASEIKYNTYDNLNSSLFASDVEYNTYNNLNWTEIENLLIQSVPNFTEFIIFHVILFTVCFLGLVGNGKVIWILGFHMKTNSFSIYVLNLAVADSGILILKVLVKIFEFLNAYHFRIYLIFSSLYFVMHNTSQLLLISISMDRCVSVLFPIWHQCHRPPKLSLIVCVITWVLPFVYFALEMVMTFSNTFLMFQIIFSSLISYPIVVIFTLILLVKIFIKPRQQKRKKVLTVALLALVCFIVLRLPLTIFSIIVYAMPVMSWIEPIIISSWICDMCIAVNSSINPILYFLAGRNKEDRSRVSMKLALRRVFRNEEDIKEDGTQPDETQL